MEILLKSLEDDMVMYYRQKSRGYESPGMTLDASKSGLKLEEARYILDADAILPPGTIWLSPQRRFVVVQKPPEMRTVHIRPSNGPECQCGEYEGEICDFCEGYEDFTDDNTSNWIEYNLPIPWQLYTFHVHRSMIRLIEVSIVNQDIIDSEDPQRNPMPLPNVYSGSTLCGGTADLSSFENVDTPGLCMNNLIENFWNSAFNTDVISFLNTEPAWSLGVSKSPGIIPFFEEWSKLTIENVTEVFWQLILNPKALEQHHRPLREALDDYVAREAYYSTPKDFEKILRSMHQVDLYDL